jgi:histone H3/H4
MAKEVLVVQSKVKAYAKKKGMRIGTDALSALSDKVRECVDLAAGRAKENKRGTIKARDI